MKHGQLDVTKEQYVDTKYLREHPMVSRTKAFGIAKEIESACTPGAVIRFGRCLRVRKDVFFDWVNEHSLRPGGARDHA